MSDGPLDSPLVAAYSFTRRVLIMAAVVLGSTLYSTTQLVASGMLPQMQGSMAATADEIVIETLAADVSERGATRMDDKTSEASMEKRKKDGYF